MNANPKRKLLYTLPFWAALVLLLLLSVILTACGGADDLPSEERVDKEPLAEAGKNEPVLAEYTIVRGDSSGNPVLKQVLNLRAAVRDRHKIDLDLTTDFAPDEGGPEILVGLTNRQQSIDVAKELTEETRFIIRTVDDKIVIVANTIDDLAAAVSCFCTEYLTEDVTAIDRVETSDALILLNSSSNCSFVIPDDASDAFAECASNMLSTLGVDRFSLIRYADYGGGCAVMLGCIPEDQISIAYADSVAEGGYIARTAAGNVYLQGCDEFLTLTSFADFLYDLQNALNWDFYGNRNITVPAGYSFNRTWEHTVPKPAQAALESSESISGAAVVFNYSNVSEYSYQLFKRMLKFLNYTQVPSSDNLYLRSDSAIALSYDAAQMTLNVVVTGSETSTNNSIVQIG